MSNRKRNVTMTIRVTEEERMEILSRMLETVAPSLTEFVIAMCRDGEIVVNEELKELNKELRYQGNNLNQLVRLAHEGRIKVLNLDELMQVYIRLLLVLTGEK